MQSYIHVYDKSAFDLDIVPNMAPINDHKNWGMKFIIELPDELMT